MEALYFFDSYGPDHFSIKSMGEELPDQLKAELKRRLQELEQKAPALSFIKLTYLNTAEGIKGSLKINSPGRIFRAVFTGEGHLSVYEKMESDINKQLLSWKKNRFSSSLQGRRMDGAQKTTNRVRAT